MTVVPLNCGHGVKFGAYPPKKGEIVLCPQCDDYRTVIGLTSNRASHQDCDHPRTPAARRQCRSENRTSKRAGHEECDHPPTTAAYKACRKRREGRVIRQYINHRDCDHPKTRRHYVLCREVHRAGSAPKEPSV